MLLWSADPRSHSTSMLVSVITPTRRFVGGNGAAAEMVRGARVVLTGAGVFRAVAVAAAIAGTAGDGTRGVKKGGAVPVGVGDDVAATVAVGSGGVGAVIGGVGSDS